MADDVKPSGFSPVGKMSKPQTLLFGSVIDLPGIPPEKVPQGKKIVNYTFSWSGLLVDE